MDELPEVARTAGPDEERLEAEYYDTDDLRLIRRWMLLVPGASDAPQMRLRCAQMSPFDPDRGG